MAGGAAPPGRPGPAPLRSACAPLSRSLSPLCSFLCLLQLFFSQSSGPQLCLPGLLRSLLVRYRWCPGRGGARPAARRPAAPAGRRPQLPVARHGTGPRAQAQGRDGLAGGDRAEDAVRLGATLLTAVTSLTRSPRRPPPSLSPPSPPSLAEGFASGSGGEPGGRPQGDRGITPADPPGQALETGGLGLSWARLLGPPLPESEPFPGRCVCPLHHGHCPLPTRTPGSPTELAQPRVQFGLGTWKPGTGTLGSGPRCSVSTQAGSAE